MSRADTLQTLLARIPMVRTLGMVCEIRGDDMITILPFREQLIGNANIRALHGGAMAGFLELTAMAQLYLVADNDTLPRTINLTVDYLRQGLAQDLYARAHIIKQGRRIASVRAEAWQAERANLVVAVQAHFLVARETDTDTG